MVIAKLSQGCLIVWVGTMGSGKTLSMVKEARKYQENGFTVYSNFHLSFPHVLLTKDLVKKMLKGEFELENAVLLLDEVHQIVDSRRGTSTKGVLFSYLVNQSRKKSVRIFMTTQFFSQIDGRIRLSTSLVVKCRSFKLNDYTIITETLYKQVSADDFASFKIISYIGNDYFDMYDSGEAIYLGNMDMKDEKTEKDEKSRKNEKKDDKLGEMLRNFREENKILKVSSQIKKLQDEINREFSKN